MKVFIYKYALTKGIVGPVEAEIVDDKYAMVRDFVVGRIHRLFTTEWSTTRQGALEGAAKLRESKIRSLKKQLTRIQDLDFSEPKTS